MNVIKYCKITGYYTQCVPTKRVLNDFEWFWSIAQQKCRKERFGKGVRCCKIINKLYRMLYRNISKHFEGSMAAASCGEPCPAAQCSMGSSWQNQHLPSKINKGQARDNFKSFQMMISSRQWHSATWAPNWRSNSFTTERCHGNKKYCNSQVVH